MGGGGALYSVSFNPKNPQEIWMPTDMGELFHTLDGGRTWTYPDLETLTAHIDSRVQWTDVDGMIYVHDWNGYPVKSTDGGKTWQRLKNWGISRKGRASSCGSIRAMPCMSLAAPTRRWRSPRRRHYVQEDLGQVRRQHPVLDERPVCRWQEFLGCHD